MTVFSARANLAQRTDFIERVSQAAVKYAMSVAQDANATATDVQFTKAVLASPDPWARTFAVALAADPEALTGQPNSLELDTAEGDTTLSYALEQRVWPAYAAEIPTPGL